eukprot:gene18142-19982_t
MPAAPPEPAPAEPAPVRAPAEAGQLAARGDAAAAHKVLRAAKA